MKKLLPYFINTSIGACVALDYFLAYEGLGRMALFMSWIIICLSFFSLALDGEEEKAFSSNNKVSISMRVITFTNIALMVYCGWMVTAIFLFLAWLFLYGKRLSFQMK